MGILIVTDYRGFLRQGIRHYYSLDIKIIKDILTKEHIGVTEISYEEIANTDIDIKNNIIIYTSSQNLEYKRYIDDILYHLNKNNTLIPRYDIFRAHENKGYQEIIKKEIGLDSIKGMYFGNLKGLENNKSLINDFPLVLKKINGAGSINVHKVNNYKDLCTTIKKWNKKKGNFFMKLVKIIEKVFPQKYNYEPYKDDIFSGTFVFQEFINCLKDDWKVLIFGDKYYILNRKVRDNDFRASGSGKLSFIDPPLEVLNYAKFVYEKLDVPFASLDIAFDQKKCYLIEFQGTHFGPYTLVNSDYYFYNNDSNWEKIYKKSTLEEEYALAIIKYIKKKNILFN